MKRELDALADTSPPPMGMRREQEIRRAIDAGLAAPAVTARRVWPWAMLGAAAAAAAIVLWLVMRPGTAGLVVKSGAIADVPIGTPVEAHDRVVLRTPDDSTVEATDLTRFVRADRDATRWQLERGRLTSHVTKRKAGQTFEVSTPEATVVVVGTKFSVDRAIVGGVPATRVEVEEGIVRVTPVGGQVVWVHAGEHWPAEHVEVAVAPIDAPVDAPAEAVHETRPVAPIEPKVVEKPHVPFDASAIRKVIRAGNLADARKLIDDGRKAAHAAPDLAELGILTAEAELAGRATKPAIELYLAVVRDYPTTPQAEQALFAAAQLAFDRPDAGYRPEAMLRDYLDTYPRGQFAGDAKRLLDRAKR